MELWPPKFLKSFIVNISCSHPRLFCPLLLPTMTQFFLWITHSSHILSQMVLVGLQPRLFYPQTLALRVGPEWLKQQGITLTSDHNDWLKDGHITQLETI